MKPSKANQNLLSGDSFQAGVIRLCFLVVVPFALLISTRIYNLIYKSTPIPPIIEVFLLIYLLGLISAFASSVYYIKDIYNIEYANIPFRYFMACFFGWFQPQVKVTQTEGKSKEYWMAEKIGGPALLDIDPGFVVLTESLTTPGKIYGAGKGHFMPRNERIYEIVDLREQEGTIDKPITATTRDGIKITVEHTKFNYRIWDSRWENLYKDMSVTRNPYPYSKQAIYDYAYNRPVVLKTEENVPEMVSWADAVQGRVSGIIKEYISEHKLDDIIAPRDQEKMDVRDEIRKKAYQPNFKEGLRAIGTILNWWDPGEFSSIEDVEKQFVSNWSVDIKSNIDINKAYGEAQTLAYQEMGRAEAEAELLMSIIHSMDGIQLGKDKVQTLQNLILLHTAQVIKAFNSSPAGSQKDSEAKDTESKDFEHPSH